MQWLFGTIFVLKVWKFIKFEICGTPCPLQWSWYIMYLSTQFVSSQRSKTCSGKENQRNMYEIYLKLLWILLNILGEIIFFVCYVREKKICLNILSWFKFGENHNALPPWNNFLKMKIFLKIPSQKNDDYLWHMIKFQI